MSNERFESGDSKPQGVNKRKYTVWLQIFDKCKCMLYFIRFVFFPRTSVQRRPAAFPAISDDNK